MKDLLKVNFLGDSITEGCGASSPANCFVSVLARTYPLAARNYGIGGTRIARQQIPSAETRFDQDFCSRYQEMAQDADVIIIFGGTNDHGHGDAPFGAPADRTVDTFQGACHCLFSGIKEHFPHALTLVLTPLHRQEEVNEKGHLSHYVQAIRDIAGAYDLPVLDLYETSVISTATLAQLTDDGLHPNDAGHAILAREIGAFLSDILAKSGGNTIAQSDV